MTGGVKAPRQKLTMENCERIFSKTQRRSKLCSKTTKESRRDRKNKGQIKQNQPITKNKQTKNKTDQKQKQAKTKQEPANRNKPKKASETKIYKRSSNKRSEREAKTRREHKG